MVQLCVMKPCSWVVEASHTFCRRHFLVSVDILTNVVNAPESCICHQQKKKLPVGGSLPSLGFICPSRTESVQQDAFSLMLPAADAAPTSVRPLPSGAEWVETGTQLLTWTSSIQAPTTHTNIRILTCEAFLIICFYSEASDQRQSFTRKNLYLFISISSLELIDEFFSVC